MKHLHRVPTLVPGLLVACLLSSNTWGQAGELTTTELIGSRVDAIFANWDRNDSPGCALAVIQAGRVVYARGYGMANLDHDIAITPETVFHVASVSKHFTAAAIVLLAADGKLSLDDDIRHYVPEVPDFGVTITIRHLLHHTSGLRDQWEFLNLSGWRYSRDLITDGDVLQMVSRQKGLNFRPGDRHLYSNTGYTLLGQVVKRVSGQTLREFTSARIFGPLGMSSTHFRDSFGEVVKNQAYGYEPAGAGFKLSVTNFDTAGATSLLTNVMDLAAWDHNFYETRVGGSALIEQLQQRGQLNSGEQLQYALGLMLGTYRGLPSVGHGGADAGYRAIFWRLPTEQFAVACLCNAGPVNVEEYVQRVADIWLDGEFTESSPHEEVATPTVEVADLQTFTGVYWERINDTFMQVQLRDDRLVGIFVPGQEIVLTAIGTNRFRPANASTVMEFATDPVTRTTRLVLRRPSGEVDTLERVEPPLDSIGDLSVYAGTYVSEELDPAFRILVDGGKLVMTRIKSEPAVLVPVGRGAFVLPTGTWRFVRSEKGQVTGAILNGRRISNVRFHRVANLDTRQIDSSLRADSSAR